MSHAGNEAMRTSHLRRRLAVPAAALALGLVAAACSSGSSDSDGVSGGDELPAEGPLTMAWYGSDARNAAVQAVVDVFGEENPDLVIETQPTTFDGHWDRLSVQASANNLPCIPAMQSRYQTRYEDRGSLLPLEDLIEDGTIDVSGIPAEVVESNRNADGHIYSIPYGIWYEGAVLNVPALEDAGVPVPEPDNDWAGYVDWAAEVQPQLGEAYALASQGGSITQFQMWALSKGEDLFADTEAGFSKETLVEWYDMWLGAIEAGATPSADVASEYAGVPTNQGMMAVGLTLVSATGDNNASDMQLTLDQNGLGAVSMAPAPTGGQPQVVGANSWAISENCTNVAAAVDFINYFINSSDGAFTLETQTGLPPVTSIADEMLASDEVAPSIKERIDLYNEILAGGGTVDIWPDGTQQLVAQFTTRWEEVAFGQSTPDAAADAFIAQLETALSGF
ncbi:ABC transporter substrate-binding protein [Pseudactinotalea suaedae]|uniref:ABC transporter substrate-binding protein n=1 Tax=Pseudactinotalea suaedae TaxID=1524924 RepID=UPI0012E1C93D|nr:extracellular solute-binding protein [Pseudactinotalea suaedae]